MKVFKLVPSDNQTLAGMAEMLMREHPNAIPVRFLMPDSFDPSRDYPFLEEVIPTKEAKPKEEKKEASGKKGHRGYPSVKVEITGTLAEKLSAYMGDDKFLNSVKEAWKKYGRLSPAQIFWLEKRLGESS